MNKILVTEEVKDKLQSANVNLEDSVEAAEVIEKVNNSKIAVARFDESTDRVVIKQNLCG